ncbi:MAG: S41 family peptidase [Pseudomonadota bacterium]
MDKSFLFCVARYWLCSLLSVVGACHHFSPIAYVDDLPSTHRGVWQSDGYGYLLDLSGKQLAVYDITADVCIYNKLNSRVLSHYINKTAIRFVAGTGRLEFATPLDEYAIELYRRDSLPKRCSDRPSDAAEASFDAFVSFMRTHYAFFDLYGVDWERQAAVGRSRLNLDTTQAQLFEILSAMIEPLRDGHLTLSGTIDGQAAEAKPGVSEVDLAFSRIAGKTQGSSRDLSNKFLKHYWFEEIPETLLKGQGQLRANKFIQYGVMSDDIGYIAIATTAAYAGRGPFHEREDLQVLHETLDEVITLFERSKVKAVVIDLSINFGGYSFPAWELASRFAADSFVAYRKQAQDSQYQKPHVVVVRPSERQRYLGPVYVLTSDMTVSGGEEMTMALRALPRTVHMGEATRGALSDVLEKRLPNGWVLTMSNELYEGPEGQLWEGRGIPPELPLTVFDRTNPYRGHREALQRVTEVIDNSH